MGQQKQPAIGANLNRGHPLAYGAHYMWVFNAGGGQLVVDYAAQRAEGSVGYSATELANWAPKVEPLGLHPAMTAGTGSPYALRIYPLTKSPLLGEQVTFFWQSSYSLANDDVFVAGAHIQIKKGNGIIWNGGTEQMFGTTASQRSVVGVSIDADAGVMTVVENGVVLQDAVAFTQGTPAGYTSVRALVDQWGNHYPNFWPACLYVFNGAKTLDQLLWMSSDPYAMFEDDNKRRFLFLGLGQTHWPPISDISAGGWTPSSGSDLFAMVDEQPTPSDSDKITDTTQSTAALKLARNDNPAAGVCTMRVRGKIV